MEVKGPFGWESIATAFMKDGKYLAASANHYSVGSYKEDGDNLKLSVKSRQYANLRTVFGIKTMETIEITYTCKVKDNKITGTGSAKGIKNHKLQMRLTKLDEIT
jgi:hypothetical protein